ncbi:MAG: prepilin-type N-terminal cleavage/methylation domain-containing protein [Rubrivivax sp.]
MKTSTATSVTPTRNLRRGVSLIEALVAMAVMAFGMLGVLGMQATLRANSDLSKQRSEATRLAQEKIEAWRSFSVLPVTTGVKSYADISTASVETLNSFISNTSYSRTATVTESSPVGHKTLVVDVSWADRSGVQHNVRLFSVAARLSPDLAATMVVAPQGAGGMREPGGRRRGIPPQAKNFGDGTSGFRPPTNATGVTWVFNNVSGLITSVCTTSAADNATLTLASLTGCNATQAYQLISGYIRFLTGTAGAPTVPTAALIAQPTDAPGTTPNAEVEVVQTAPTTGTRDRASGNCFHGSAATYIEYFCAIPVQSPTPATWSGTLQIKESSLATPNGITLSTSLADTVVIGRRKVCRYRALVDPVPNPIYQNVNVPLANENLVLIRPGDGTAAFACPNPPSRAHQPAT